MTPAAVLLITEAEAVISWRETILIQAGYTPDDALLLAVMDDVDLHTAVYLIESVCDPELALDVLL